MHLRDGDELEDVATDRHAGPGDIDHPAPAGRATQGADRGAGSQPELHEATAGGYVIDGQRGHDESVPERRGAQGADHSAHDTPAVRQPLSRNGCGRGEPRLGRRAALYADVVTASDLGRSSAVVIALAAVNLAAQRTPLPADLVVPVGVLGLVALAEASGLEAEEMGLGRAAGRRVLGVAGISAALTVAGVAAAAALPGADGFRQDDRYPSAAAASRAALTRIPLAVAIPEEVAFRGLLDAVLGRHLSPTAATVWGALAFGAWHALGAATLARDNAGLGRVLGSGRSGSAAGVGGAVATTALAGVGFLALRRRSGSVLPGIAVHWALNAAGALAAGLRRPGPRE